MTTKLQSRRVSKKSAGKSGAESTPIVSPLIKGGHIVLLGDCLDVMTELRDTRGFRESVDLVYLDPPFNSEAEYAFVFGLENADKRAVVAFSDTWKWTEKTEDNYREYIAQGCGGRFLEAMHSTLGTTGTGGAMLSYLTMMLPRLELMRDLMKPTGSIYLHCDQTASHYLKLAMDAIFGADNFHNDVIWGYEKPRSASRVWRRNHDNLLFYTKGRRWKFNPQRVPTLDGKFEMRKPFKRPDGTVWHPKAPGKQAADWWYDIPSFATAMSAPERMGFPTQKPLKLLRRVVEASSNSGDLVMDPFCGCGTTLAACSELKRQFIGVDLEPFAAGTIRTRMEGPPYGMKVRIGYAQPQSADDFAALARDGRYLDFQYHAITAIPGGIPNTTKSGDQGVDGWVFAQRTGERKNDVIVVSVKAGAQVAPAMVRELGGVVANMRPSPLAGILITLQDPTPGMLTAAAQAGYYKDGDRRRPKIQILPIRRLLAQRWDLPRLVESKGAREFRNLFPTL